VPDPPLIVYTRPMCILCAQVKEQLAQAGLSFKSIDVADLGEQERLVKKYAARSFPLLVLRGKYLGGYTHLVHLLATGRLAALVGSA
jgi:glutaredoxin